MEAVPQLVIDGEATEVVFGKDQPEYLPLPAVVYPDGRILIEWTFTEEERARIARGENLRHWIWKSWTERCERCGHETPSLFKPVRLEITDERIA